MIDVSKKVLLICTGAFHTDGGIAAVNRISVQAIIEKGYFLDVFSLMERDDCIDTHCMSTEGKIRCRAFSGNKYMFTLAVWHALLQKTYDYVFADHVNLAFILAPFAWLRLCNYVVWLYGIDVFPPRPDLQGKIGLLGARKCLAISEFTKQSVIQRFPRLLIEVCDLSLDPVRHVSNMTIRDSSPIILQTAHHGYSELQDSVILHVGRMVSGERYKGQESLIRAFSIISNENPGAQLVLVGQGDDMQRLKGIVASYPSAVQARIFFPGYVSDDMLDAIYRKCYIFAMPSIGEGFGLVYLEAMMRAKACLGGRVDATPYVIRDGVTGLLVNDPKSPEEVAKTLKWFLSHPEETHQMGLAGSELVRSYYLFSHFQERFWKAVS
jgi:phosphatidyl-myo-inositol dimannoside synthase